LDLPSELAASNADLDDGLDKLDAFAGTDAKTEGLVFETDNSDDALSLDLDLDFDEAKPTASEDAEALSLDLDFDAEKPSPIEPEDEFSLDLELDGVPEVETDGQLSLSAGLEDDLLSIDTDLDLGELSLDDEDDSRPSYVVSEATTLEKDLADLDADLDDAFKSDSKIDEISFNLEDNDVSGTEIDLAGDIELDDLNLDDLSVDDKALEDTATPGAGGVSVDEGIVSGGTVVNEALSDESIEQVYGATDFGDLSLDEELPSDLGASLTVGRKDGGSLESEFDLSDDGLDLLDAKSSDANSSVDQDLSTKSEGDMDLSSLDDELDALTSDLDELSVDVSEEELSGTIDLNADLGSEGEGEFDTEFESDAGDAVAVNVAASNAVMEEPVIDFDDFEDELEEDNSDMVEVVESANKGTADVDDMGEDTMFDQAISEVPEIGLEFDIPEVDPDADEDDEDLDFLSDTDETATKLDLARAYIDMDDQEGAREIIREIIAEGSDQQRAEAEGLLARLEE
jgi:pilus assembly protein FimV